MSAMSQNGVAQLTFSSTRPYAEPNATDQASYIHPATAERYDLGEAKANDGGTWTWPGMRPIYHDLLLVLENG